MTELYPFVGAAFTSSHFQTSFNSLRWRVQAYLKELNDVWKWLSCKIGFLKWTKFSIRMLSLFLFLPLALSAQDNNGDSLPPARDQGLWQTLIMVAVAMLFFYFILWRPEQKRRKAMENQRNALKKGDRVTAMGIVGTVLRIQENTVILKMYDGSKIEVLKPAITDVIPGSEEDTKKAEKEEKNLE